MDVKEESMCVEHKKVCKCGRNSASFQFRDEMMPEEVLEGLYCPFCSAGVAYDEETMVSDNGWVIKYDMDVVRFMRHKLPVADASAAYLFDEGYCTWDGVYPTDRVDSIREREELVKLAKIDKKKYVERFKTWGINRMDRLAKEGWRKANEKQQRKEPLQCEDDAGAGIRDLPEVRV
jgi:hypothetical protein